MTIIAIPLSCVLVPIAVLHFLWAIKIWFPVKDEERLAKTVTGFKGRRRMPSTFACLFVSIALFLTAALPLLLTNILRQELIPPWLAAMFCFLAGFLFVFRGIIGYLPVFARMTPEQPFRTYDRYIYSPLCLVIGSSFLFLVWQYMVSL